jgi:hypothetical protein
MPLRLCIKTWQPGIVPASGQSTYDYPMMDCFVPMLKYIPQILKVIQVEKVDDLRRPYMKQLVTKKLAFPLPHRVPKAATKKIFAANRPSTFY